MQLLPNIEEEFKKYLLRVCIFGSYLQTTNGIASGTGGELIKRMLLSQNIKVVECHEDINGLGSFFSTNIKLFFKFFKTKNFEVMIIPFHGIFTLPLAKLICRKPIIYLPAFSYYDTLVNDRKKLSKKSIKAKFIHWIDGLACKITNLTILESTAEIDYFVDEFSLPRKKFRQLYLTADTKIFKPLPIKKRDSVFKVLFFGTFIPLHGVDTIIESALLLKEHKDILFTFCGDGQMKPQIELFAKKSKLSNVQFLGFVTIDTLLENLKDSDICLGIFGDSIKAKKSMTNKVYQVLISQKPLITMESPSVLEAHLIDKDNCIIIPPADPKKLSEAILYLKQNQEICEKIAVKGKETYDKYLSTENAGKMLKYYVEEVAFPSEKQ